jgi:hypothetical protein
MNNKLLLLIQEENNVINLKSQKNEIREKKIDYIWFFKFKIRE